MSSGSLTLTHPLGGSTVERLAHLVVLRPSDPTLGDFLRDQSYYRRVFFIENGLGPWPCYFCGEPVTRYDGPNGGDKLLVHHEDENRDNNHPDNLKPSHWDCHTAWHNRFGKRAEVYDDPEYRRNHAEATRERWDDPEFRARHTEGIRKRSDDPEWQRRHAAAWRRRWDDPEHRAKHAEACRKLAQDPEWQRNITEANRKRSVAYRLANPGLPEFPCPHCEHVATRANNLKRHVRKQHPEAQP